MKRILIVLIIFTGFTFSCGEDFINKRNPNEISSDLVLSNLNDISAAVIGTYNPLQSENYYGRNFVVVPDLMGMDVLQQPDNSNRGTAQYQYTSLNPNNAFSGGVWLSCYSIIARANIILAALPGIAGDDVVKDQLAGELLALRALAHFDLVRWYAFNYNAAEGAPGANGQGGHLGVPVMTAPVLPDAKPARKTVAEVYDQVIDDLNESIGLMDDDETFSRIRFSQGAAQALLARVYLYKEDWANAELMATNVINNTSYSFIPAADYLASWNGNVANTESIFEIQFSSLDYNGTDQLGAMYSPVGYGDYWPTTDLDAVFNEISTAADVRDGLWDTSVDPRIARKYKGPQNTAGTDNTKVFRLSEMYLIRAEARAKQSNFTGSRQDLNALRTARSAPASAATDGQLIDAILKERRVELAFEGHSLFDIKRTKSDVVRTDCSGSPVCTVEYPYFMFAHPIPQAEINANSNMVQNQGY